MGAFIGFLKGSHYGLQDGLRFLYGFLLGVIKTCSRVPSRIPYPKGPLGFRVLKFRVLI